MTISDYLQVFTDGSVSFIDFRIQHKLPKGTSIFSAEAWTAIYLAIKRKWKKTVIFTNSLSLLQTLKNCQKNCSNHIIAKIRHTLYQA